MATLHELDTIYDTEGAYDLFEVMLVRNVNERRMSAVEGDA